MIARQMDTDIDGYGRTAVELDARGPDVHDAVQLTMCFDWQGAKNEPDQIQ
jgi:hypothetical protein